jgi:hypothetical protein
MRSLVVLVIPLMISVGVLAAESTKVLIPAVAFQGTGFCALLLLVALLKIASGHGLSLMRAPERARDDDQRGLSTASVCGPSRQDGGTWGDVSDSEARLLAALGYEASGMEADAISADDIAEFHARKHRRTPSGKMIPPRYKDRSDAEPLAHVVSRWQSSQQMNLAGK